MANTNRVLTTCLALGLIFFMQYIAQSIHSWGRDFYYPHLQMKKVRHKAIVTAGDCIATAFQPKLPDSRWCTLPATPPPTHPRPGLPCTGLQPQSVAGVLQIPMGYLRIFLGS